MASSGIFHFEWVVAHCSKTRSVCGSSITPAMSKSPGRSPNSARVPRIGAEVRTGEAIRIRRLRRAEAGGDALGERFAVAGREPGPDGGVTDLDRVGVSPAAPVDVAGRPQLLEVLDVLAGELGRLDDREHVLLAGPGIDRPVGRPGPDGRLVAHHVLVVHQVGDAADALVSIGSSARIAGLVSGGGWTAGRKLPASWSSTSL